MKIIIVGAGEVGFYIAQRLSEENQNVVLIDKDPQKIKQIKICSGRKTSKMLILWLPSPGMKRLSFPEETASSGQKTGSLSLPFNRSFRNWKSFLLLSCNIFKSPSAQSTRHLPHPLWGSLMEFSSAPVTS